MTLKDICRYISDKIALSKLNIHNYVSTENMLPNKSGITKASSIPISGNAIKYEKGDILISNIRPYFMKIWHAEYSGGSSADVLCIRANDNIDNKYLYYLLSQQIFFDYVMSGCKGCKMPRGDKQHIMQWDVNIPSLATQQKIAAILGSLDDKIELNNRINKNLEEQAQALFKRWFVDFEFPDQNGQPYKLSGGAMKESELGEIPKDWDVGKFTEIINILGGGTPSTINEEFWNGEIPFFTPKDANNTCFVLSTEKYITEKGLLKCNSKLYPKNTVFITARGTVGKVILAGCNMAMNQSCYALIGKNNNAQYFVYYKTKEMVALLRGKASGAVFDAITTRDFDSETIAIPPIDAVIWFCKLVEPIMEQILINNKQNQILAQLRDSLLPKLMSNQIKI